VFWGISPDRPIRSSPRDTTNEGLPDLEAGAQASSNSTKSEAATTSGHKRKYCRHPKADGNAPEKPPSAYVLFLKQVQGEVKAESLSFTEVARLVGKRWQKLDASQRELFESHAGALKENYKSDLTGYMRTDTYKAYTQYLAEFKAKNAAQSGAKGAKRAKLEHANSSSLPGNSVGESVQPLAHQITGHEQQHSVGPTMVTSRVRLLALPSITTLPVSNVPSVQRNSLQYLDSQDRRLFGQPSNQSSISENSNMPRINSSDASVCTAVSSSSISDIGAPSPSATTTKSGRRDSGYMAGSQQSPSCQTIYGISGISGVATSPNSNMSFVPVGASGVDQCRAGSFEASCYTGTPSMPQQQPGSMPISQLIGTYHRQDTGMVSSQRTLPPLRQSSATTCATSVTGLAGRYTPNTVRMHQNTDEPMPCAKSFGP